MIYIYAYIFFFTIDNCLYKLDTSSGPGYNSSSIMLKWAKKLGQSQNQPQRQPHRQEQ